jgi:formate hydrogenlyase subunit 6/NADH:ubiquinone oxidoreductase subunit I
MKPGRMLSQVLKSFFKKPATNLYPYEKLEMADKMRGKIKFDPQACVGCKLCMRDCPSGAISIEKTGDKQFEAKINLGKCIYCAQCVDSCLKKALEFTRDIELAVLDAEKLKVVFRGGPGTGIDRKAP